MKIFAVALLLVMVPAAAITLQGTARAHKKRVHLLLSRHGLSCSNAMEVFYYDGAQEKMSDPMLTNCGRHRSTSAGEQMRELGLDPDVVLTSSMLRTMETGHYQFPGRELIPVPFLAESTLSKGNWSRSKGLMDVPLSMEKQEARLAKIYGQRSVNRNMEWMDKFGTEETRSSASWDNFTQFVARDFLPVYQDGALLHKDKDVYISVITHMGFIREGPGVKKLCDDHHYKHLTNNGLLELVYTYDTETNEMTVDEEAGCKRHKVAPVLSSTHFCQGDFGDVCDAEVKKSFPGEEAAKSSRVFKVIGKHTCCVPGVKPN